MPYTTGPESPKRIDELTPKAPAGTDFIPICPANGPTYRASVQEIVSMAGGGGSGGGLPNGDATNGSLVWDTTTNAWKAARVVKEAQNIHAGGFGTIPYQVGEHLTAHLAIGTAGQVLTVKDLGMGLFAPEWMPASGGPAYTAADAGHTLAVNMDGTGLEWQPTKTHSNKCIELLANIFARTGVVSVTLPRWMEHFIYQDTANSGVTELTVKGLEKIYGAVRKQDVHKMHFLPSLTKVVFEDLQDAKGIDFLSCPELVEIDLRYLKSVGVGMNGLTIQGCPKLTTIFLTVLESVGGIVIEGCPLLTMIPFGNIFNLRGEVSVINNGLSADGMKSILLALKDMDGKNGKCLWGSGLSLKAQGGTNAGLAALDAEAIAAKDELVARGATVQLNP